jgi:hypothetical protein
MPQQRLKNLLPPCGADPLCIHLSHISHPDDTDRDCPWGSEGRPIIRNTSHGLLPLNLTSLSHFQVAVLACIKNDLLRRETEDTSNRSRLAGKSCPNLILKVILEAQEKKTRFGKSLSPAVSRRFIPHQNYLELFSSQQRISHFNAVNLLRTRLKYTHSTMAPKKKVERPQENVSLGPQVREVSALSGDGSILRGIGLEQIF